MEDAAEEDSCPICLDALAASECLRMPDCGHRIHTRCALHAVQYDGRCPVCRNVAVPTRFVPTAPDIFTQFEQELQQREILVRRYQNRRSRAIRARNSLKRMRDQLKEERRSFEAAERDLERAWRTLQRTWWANDEAIGALKHRRRKHQRRIADLTRRLRGRLDPVIGPPPDEDDD